MSVTVILNAYRRPEYFPSQLSAIHAQTAVPDEVWVWKNTHPEADFDGCIHLPGIDAVVDSSRNFKFHGRFALGLLARTEYVAFFDDDTIPGKKWLENCIACHKEEPGILGGVGIVLRSGMYGDHDRVGWPAPSNEKAYADLVGHAWFMKTDHCRLLWSEKPISLDNGEDIQLSYLAQKYMGLRTYCPPHPPEDKAMWSSLAGDTLGLDPKGESIANPGTHLHLRREIVTKALQEGWRTVRNVTLC